jgi:DNA-binding winged helix-turn-helix (wHTH) protein/tetratricopeptide (TPR) repeat protein
LTYQFETFEVDDREFRLLERGAPVQVEPKVMRLLLYLIENRNRLVRKQELLDKVWQDSMVTENALTRVIGLLRKALNDDSHVPRFIETVPTAGYRFIAKVAVLAESPIAEPTTPMVTTPARAERRKRFGPRRWVFACVILLLAAIGVAAYFFLGHRRVVLTGNDTVVLADFDNSTGDPVFDGTLRRGMAMQLEQSPFLSLIPDDRIQQVLKEMGQPADARLTPAIAREICERTGSTAVLDGSIAPLGSQYVLGLRAKGCSSGKVLAEQQVQAARKEDVLNALDQMAGKFRTEVGESLATVEKYDTPLSEATTSSLQALKAYSLGSNKLSAGANTESLPFFSRAVELDPNFAAAYEAMSAAYTNQREPELSAESIRKAYQLREKVSERERLRIEGDYYWRGTGELEKAVSSVELFQQTYPRDSSAHNALGILYKRLGNHDKSVEESREALRLNPNAAVYYQNLGADLVSLNRLDEAEAVYKLSDERNLPYAGRPKSLYLLAFLKGDQARMAQLAASVTGKRSAEDAMLAAQADTEAWYGRLRAAHGFTQRAMDSALDNGAKETAAGYQIAAALFEAQSGVWEQGRIDANAAIKLGPNRDVRAMAAEALAQAGDTASAEKLTAKLDKDFPLDTLVQRYWLPVIRAAIVLRRKDPNRAIELLVVARPIELASATNISNPGLWPAYVRGEAYLMLHDGNRAAAEFQKFIDHRGLVRNSQIGMLARLGLARAYALQGNTTKARAAYQDFLALWKDADPDIPMLKQAQTEYSNLK